MSVDYPISDNLSCLLRHCEGTLVLVIFYVIAACYNSRLHVGPVVNTSDSVGGVGRVACKYVINPTLLMKKKFDVRFYLLVTSLSPLVISRHEAFVIRLSNEEYCNGKF